MRLAIIALLLIVGIPAAACAQEDVLDALQKRHAKIIQENESAIACILVSRSEAYQEFGQGPDKDQPGRLGAFNVKALEDHPRFKKLSEDKRPQWRKQLDFADPAFVPRSFGSGVVVDAKEGLVLTNYHVVQDATKVYVRLPGGKRSYADIHRGGRGA